MTVSGEYLGAGAITGPVADPEIKIMISRITAAGEDSLINLFSQRFKNRSPSEIFKSRQTVQIIEAV
jgi:hypothetical protein